MGFKIRCAELCIQNLNSQIADTEGVVQTIVSSTLPLTPGTVVSSEPSGSGDVVAGYDSYGTPTLTDTVRRTTGQAVTIENDAVMLTSTIGIAGTKTRISTGSGFRVIAFDISTTPVTLGAPLGVAPPSLINSNSRAIRLIRLDDTHALMLYNDAAPLSALFVQMISVSGVSLTLSGAPIALAPVTTFPGAPARPPSMVILPGSNNVVVVAQQAGSSTTLGIAHLTYTPPASLALTSTFITGAGVVTDGISITGVSTTEAVLLTHITPASIYRITVGPIIVSAAIPIVASIDYNFFRDTGIAWVGGTNVLVALSIDTNFVENKPSTGALIDFTSGSLTPITDWTILRPIGWFPSYQQTNLRMRPIGNGQAIMSYDAVFSSESSYTACLLLDGNGAVMIPSDNLQFPLNMFTLSVVATPAPGATTMAYVGFTDGDQIGDTGGGLAVDTQYTAVLPLTISGNSILPSVSKGILPIGVVQDSSTIISQGVVNLTGLTPGLPYFADIDGTLVTNSVTRDVNGSLIQLLYVGMALDSTRLLVNMDTTWDYKWK